MCEMCVDVHVVIVRSPTYLLVSIYGSHSTQTEASMPFLAFGRMTDCPASTAMLEQYFVASSVRLPQVVDVFLSHVPLFCGTHSYHQCFHFFL
jgi:hypothetical protein